MLKWQDSSLNEKKLTILNIDSTNFKHIKEELVKIEKASFQTPWTENMFNDEANNPISHFWGLYLQSEKLIGYLCCWLLTDEMQLMKIAIHTEYRRKGYGRYFLAQLLEYGLSKNIKSIWLEVRRSNTAAGSLYRSCGFKDVGNRPAYYNNPTEDALLMTYYNV